MSSAELAFLTEEVLRVEAAMTKHGLSATRKSLSAEGLPLFVIRKGNRYVDFEMVEGGEWWAGFIEFDKSHSIYSMDTERRVSQVMRKARRFLKRAVMPVTTSEAV